MGERKGGWEGYAGEGAKLPARMQDSMGGGSPPTCQHPFVPSPPPFLLLYDKLHLRVAAFQLAEGLPTARWADPAARAGKVSLSSVFSFTPSCPNRDTALKVCAPGS